MQQLQQMGIDHAGLIFYEGSKRYAVDKLANQKSEIKKSAIKKVGVFVNADYETIVNAIEEYGLTAVQLHGDETDEFCLELMDKVQVIKVFRIADEKNIDELVAPFQNVCQFFLFDKAPSGSPGGGETGSQPLAHPDLPDGKATITQPLLKQTANNNAVSPKSEVCAQVTPPPGEPEGAGPLFGGTGQQFDWTILQNASINKPFFLSGGIGLEDVEKLNAFHHPHLYAVDVNSRFEITPGVKDMKKVQEFVNALNHE